MARFQQTGAIAAIVIANVLVIVNLLFAIYTAATTAASRPSATPSGPLRTATAAPSASAQPALVFTPTPRLTPTLSATNTPTPTGTPTGVTYPFNYTVKSGDTISGLADRFKVSAKKILEANNLADANFLRIGQILIIPSPGD
ncbi:MAG: LysM peptidoglycan-binding domain-containing protein [Chloroflexi bacterium]|nr:LysM peptidoglycan-binding domain-containing protein [Chloroflexota bacterium]